MVSVPLLLSGGCSVVWGSELSDCLHCGIGGFSNSTYPALLAKQLGARYYSVAQPGAGNERIANLVINYIETHPAPGMVIVNWSYTTRHQFDECHSSLSNFYHGNPDYDNWFRAIGSDPDYSLRITHRNIHYLQCYLKLKNIPYLFTSNESDINRPDEVKYIDWDNWYWFPSGTQHFETTVPRGFYQWALENKYPIGPEHHALEEAHLDAAELIKGKFNEMVKKHLEQNRSRNQVS